MTVYAIINSGTVENIAVANTPIDVNWISLAGLDPQPGIGWSYSNGVFTSPVIEDPVTKWFIDIGPFYDRFGALKMAILTSADVGIKAILEDTKIRKWVDLNNPQVAQSLTYIGSVIPALTTQLQQTILTTPVSDVENMALKKLYF
jgi:hypothetical protein